MHIKEQKNLGLGIEKQLWDKETKIAKILSSIKECNDPDVLRKNLNACVAELGELDENKNSLSFKYKFNSLFKKLLEERISELNEKKH